MNENVYESEIDKFLSTLELKDAKDIISTIKEVSAELGKIEDANQSIKDAGANLKECFGLKPALFKKWLNYYYNNNLVEEKMKALEPIDSYVKIMTLVENN